MSHAIAGLNLEEEDDMWVEEEPTDITYYSGEEVGKNIYTMRELVLGSGVRTVVDSALYNSPNLERVDASAAVNVTLSAGCFAACANLKEIILPMVNVPANCFTSCINLSRVVFQGEDSGEVYSIGTGAFSYCRNLVSVENVPRRVVYGGDAYHKCIALTTAFAVGGRDQPELPSGLFAWCENITSLTVREGTERTGISMCSGCTRLYNLYLPKSLEIIEIQSFGNCAMLEEVRCGGAYVTTVKDVAFEYCVRLRTITFSSERAVTFSHGAFRQCCALETFTVPTRTERLGDYMFYKCTSLKTVVLNDALTWIGDGCFNECTALKDIDFGRAPRLTTIGAYSFKRTPLTKVDLSVTAVTIIGLYAFCEMPWLQELLLPPSLEIIGEGMCADSGALTSIEIPPGVKRVPRLCFSNCAALAHVDLHNADTNIEKGTFSGCTTLSLDGNGSTF